MVCPRCPGHPDYQKTDLVRGVVVVHLSWPGNHGYKKIYISEKKGINEKKELKLAERTWLQKNV